MGLDEGWLSRVQSAGLEATDRDTQIHVERSQLTEGLYSRAYIYSVCIYVYIYIRNPRFFCYPHTRYICTEDIGTVQTSRPEIINQSD